MKNDSTQGRKVMLVSVVITGLLISAYATLFAAGMSRSSIGGVFKDFAISPTTFLPWFISLVSIVAPAWWLGAWAGRIAADHGRLWALAASTAVTMACLLSLSFTIALMQPVLVTSKISTFLGRCEDAALTGLVSLFFGAVPALVTGLVSGCFLPRRTVSRS